MKRREFLKGAGVATLAAATGAPLLLLGGCGGDSSAAPADKLVFDYTETLESIRAKIAHNGYRFTVGHTWVYNNDRFPGAPTAPQEINPLNNTTPAAHTESSLLGAGALPSRYDLRNLNGHNYVGPVRDQGDSQMCWAYSACDAAGGTYNVKRGLYDDACLILAPMFLKWFQRMGAGDNLVAFQGLSYLGYNGESGCCREVDFPVSGFHNFLGASPDIPQYLLDRAKNAERFRFRRFGRIFPVKYADTTLQIKHAILKYGGVKAAALVTAAFAAYTSGVFEDTFVTPDQEIYYRSDSGHAIALVGWDDNPPEGGDGCWILRNSWGESWGEGGYMRIRYHSAHVNCAAEFIEAFNPGENAIFNISGVITGAVPVEGAATLTLTGDDSFAVTPNPGTYVFNGIANGRYLVTPACTGYTFEPKEREVIITDGDAANVDFTGTKQ